MKLLLGILSLNLAYAAPVVPPDSLAVSKIFENLRNPEVTPGAVIASPSKSNPDYFYHWVRDAAITMMSLRGQFGTSLHPSLRPAFVNYLHFSKTNQKQSTLGEPKFYVNGVAFQGPWGRPQNDGPALRALALIGFAQDLIQEGAAQNAALLKELYEPNLPATSVVKADLEYVAHHWREPSFDPWEEVSGDHFFNRMVQRKALVAGARLAEAMKDSAAAKFYLGQASEMTDSLDRFYDPLRGLILPTLNQNAGVSYKTSGIDSAVILGVLLGEMEGFSFSTRDPRVIDTARQQENAFRTLYRINQKNVRGVAIGRYPEDRYDGTSTESLGNPWFIATFGYAELCYRVARVFSAWSPERKSWSNAGDQFFNRALYHSGDGTMSEQFNRESGVKMGARDLTWSYAAELLAWQARQKIK